MRSKYNRINIRDIIYGAVITAATTFVGFLIDFLNAAVTALTSNAAFDFSFKAMLPFTIAAVVSGLMYVLKQLKSNSEGVLLKKEE